MATTPVPARLMLPRIPSFDRRSRRVAERDGERFVHRNFDRAGVGAGGDDLSRAQAFAARREEIREPDERAQRMTVAMPAVVRRQHAPFARDRHRERGERRIGAAREDRPDVEALVLHAVGHHLEPVDGSGVGIARAEELQHQPRLADRGAHVRFRIWRIALREIALQHEGDFGFDPRDRAGRRDGAGRRAEDRRREDRRRVDPSRRRRQRTLPAADLLAQQRDDAPLDRERRLDVDRRGIPAAGGRDVRRCAPRREASPHRRSGSRSWSSSRSV